MTTGPHATEAQFQRQIVELAELCGWRTNHVFRSASSRAGGGWRTATTCVGWPDLCIWRPDQFLAIEIKTGKGRLTAEQRDVLATLRAARIDARCWRPSDWPEIERTLRTIPALLAEIEATTRKANP
jgi:hypothetical protein